MPIRPAPPRHRRDLLTPLVAGGAAVLFWATVAGSHTNPVLNRVSRVDGIGVLLPNWRFFAPLPARQDHHVVFRTRVRGAPGPWQEVQPIAPRHWLHMVWFPGRRRDKGLFDLYVEFGRLVESMQLRKLPRTPQYRLLLAFVAERIRAAHAGPELPEAFQFALVKSAGVDESEEPEYVMVSPWEPVRDTGAR